MHRFIHHWRRYVSVSEDARDFLLQHARVVQFAAGDHFMRFGERKPYWCLVLEGLAFGYVLYADGRRRILWFATPMQYFAGVQHLYTRRLVDHAIEFATPSVILQISVMHMREAKERYREMNELLHIHKQQQINRQEQLHGIVLIPDTYERFASFMDKFPEIAAVTTGQEQADLLNMGRSMLFEARKRVLRRK